MSFLPPFTLDPETVNIYFIWKNNKSKKKTTQNVLLSNFWLHRGRLTVGAGRSGQRLDYPCLTIRFLVVVVWFSLLFFRLYKNKNEEKKTDFRWPWFPDDELEWTNERNFYGAGIAKLSTTEKRKTVARDGIFRASFGWVVSWKSGDGRRRKDDAL